MSSVTIRIAAANGDGVESSGALLIKVATRNGFQVFGYRGYQSIIRGGHVWYQIRLSDGKLHSHGDGIDILIALNQDAIKNQKSHLNDNAVVIYDPSKTNVTELDSNRYRLTPIPLLDIAVKQSGDPIMRNVAAIGAALGFIGIDIKVFDDVIRKMFGRKGDKVVNDNINVATAGYNSPGVTKAFDIKGDGKQRYSMDGNSAFAFGAYTSGCKFYAAYPMTPASGILQWFAQHQDKGVLFKQTEDEIAAINMAIGAASAGVRAMCGTSGGGFSLMVEGLGLAGMLEVPLVVAESQRTGPSTGLPTKTEQADLLFVMHSSQGEFPRIVMAPRSVEECFYVGKEALNLAERYQCPVVVMLDLFLSEHVESVDGFDFDSIGIDRGKVAAPNPNGGRFKRYELSADGISPRSFPGMPGLEFVSPSDEHNEYGDLVSDALSGIDEHVEMRRKMHSKRMSKIDTMLMNEKCFFPEVSNEGADHFLMTFGSTAQPATEAIGMLNEAGLNVGLITFKYLMPLDQEKTKQILSGKKIIDVECNYTAQLAYVVKANTGMDITDRILKYDGEAITPGEIAMQAADIIKKQK
ncbi:MAG: 2-oxoacid:acceptor oxidoreductase subunit alpha [Candidatus Micrarchaeota archaeon]|nr:2-oxoacid:acceptor oxidoreductase subunit alpha [Candidatus Micrarchaeota archaeon]